MNVSKNNLSFDQAISMHDNAVAAAGLTVWVGSEPTFTDRFSESAEWLREANGKNKQQRACQLLASLHNARDRV